VANETFFDNLHLWTSALLAKSTAGLEFPNQFGAVHNVYWTHWNG
jgi:hypothetical protein